MTEKPSEVPDQCEGNISGFEHEPRIQVEHTDHRAVQGETMPCYCQLGETPCFFLFSYLIGLDVHVSDTGVLVRI
jgi:hypothetical protein